MEIGDLTVVLLFVKWRKKKHLFLLNTKQK